ncbi:MAG: hypothetical protein ACYTFG_11215 [Planctomycetota bacterium]|jgi:tetratricopeptide (TPR) repeat protein
MNEFSTIAAGSTGRNNSSLLRILALPILFVLAGCGGGGEFRATLDEGKLLFEKEKFKPASERLKTATELEPDEPEPRFFLARTQIRLGQLKEAGKNLHYLLDEIGLDSLEDPRDAGKVYVDLGALALRLAIDRKATGSYFKAQGYFEKALEIESDNYPARLGKALSLYGLGKLYSPDGAESAFHLFRTCARQMPDNPEPHFFLGMCNERDRLLSTLDALKLFEKVLHLSGELEKMKKTGSTVTRIFDVPVQALDRDYALLALERIIPLRARIVPKDLGLDGAEARAIARKRHDLYNRLGGKRALSKSVIEWMQGATTSAAPPPVRPTGEEGGGSRHDPPARTGVRPQLTLVSPAATRVKTGTTLFPITVRSTDDSAGLTLEVTLNGKSYEPEFRDLRIEQVEVSGRAGEKRTMTFDVPLSAGKNDVSIHVMDREGLTSTKIALEAEYRRPSIFSVVVGYNGPAGNSRLQFAESDSKDFLRLLSDRFGLPPANRVLLVGEAATPKAFSKAVETATASAWESDIIVIYFAGFGATVDRRHGPERYLVMSGFERTRPDLGGFALSGLGKRLADTRAGRIAIVLDTGFGPKPEAGGRTFPEGVGLSDSWEGHVMNLFQIPPAIQDRVSVVLAADGTGTAQEFDSVNPAWRKGGIFTTFLLEAMGRRPSEDGPVTDPPSRLKDYLKPRLTYFAARAGMIQSPIVIGPKQKPWLGR